MQRYEHSFSYKKNTFFRFNNSSLNFYLGSRTSMYQHIGMFDFNRTSFYWLNKLQVVCRVGPDFRQYKLYIIEQKALLTNKHTQALFLKFLLPTIQFFTLITEVGSD